jgi:hypothetical protein
LPKIKKDIVIEARQMEGKREEKVGEGERGKRGKKKKRREGGRGRGREERERRGVRENGL